MKLIPLILIICCQIGCGTIGQTIRVQNNTLRDVTMCTVRCGPGFQYEYGTLPAGVWKTYGGADAVKNTEICKVSWVDASGGMKNAVVKLSDYLPRRYRGGLKFVLEESCEVVVLPKEN